MDGEPACRHALVSPAPARLAGLFLVDDDTTDALDQPRTYGLDDIPLIIQDRRFTADGAGLRRARIATSTSATAPK